VTKLEYFSFWIYSNGTNIAVGSYAPYYFGIWCPYKGLPPNNNLLPGISKIESIWFFIFSLVHESTGPTLKSVSFLYLANSSILSIIPAFIQFSCANKIL